MSPNNCLFLLLAVLITTSGCTKRPESKPKKPKLAQKAQTFPDGIGRTETIQHCTICHTDKLIIQNRMPAKKWDEAITWMQEKQNMWQLQPEVRKRIVAYLGKHFNIPKVPDTANSNNNSLPPPRANPIW